MAQAVERIRAVERARSVRLGQPVASAANSNALVDSSVPPSSGVLGNGGRPAGSPDKAKGVTCGVGVYVRAVELYRTQGQDSRARGCDVLDHDVEMDLLCYRGVGPGRRLVTRSALECHASDHAADYAR